MIGLGEAFVRGRVVPPGTKGAVRSRLQDTYEAVLRHAEGSLEMLIALGYPEVRRGVFPLQPSES